MTVAYRDDLEAAQARVRDLEREAEQLRRRNAELEPPAREAADTPAEVRADRRWRLVATKRERVAAFVIVTVLGGWLIACTVGLGAYPFVAPLALAFGSLLVMISRGDGGASGDRAPSAR